MGIPHGLICGRYLRVTLLKIDPKRNQETTVKLPAVLLGSLVCGKKTHSIFFECVFGQRPWRSRVLRKRAALRQGALPDLELANIRGNQPHPSLMNSFLKPANKKGRHVRKIVGGFCTQFTVYLKRAAQNSGFPKGFTY